MRRLLALLGLAGAAAAALAVVRRNRSLTNVAPDLRNPTLLLPMSFTGPTSLKLGRRMLAQASPVVCAAIAGESWVPSIWISSTCMWKARSDQRSCSAWMATNIMAISS